MTGAEPVGDEAVPPHVAMSWNEAVRDPDALTGALASWMPTCRWFAAKDLTLRGVSVDDVVMLAGDTALLIVRAAFADGDDHLYAVPLLLGSGESPREITTRAPRALVVATTEEGVVVDAMSVEDGARGVIGAALRRHRYLGRQAVASGDPPAADVAHLLDDAVDVRILSAEQSNTSVIVGGEVIGKLVRRLSPGESPDVSVPRHLRAAGFAHVPDVVGTLDVEVGPGHTFNAVVVHEAIEHEADLWQTSQELLERILELDATDATDATGGDVAQLQRIVRLLAQRTAEMHLALAGGSPAFEPQPLDLAWQQSLRSDLEASMTETRQALARARPTLPDDVEPVAAAVLQRLDRLPTRFDALATRALDGARIRVHGDLHLGQVLWTGTDVVVIDFEGEPGRPIEQRTVKQSPLADVAGMLRSFDYAGRVALAGIAGDGADGAPRERRRQDLTSTLQDAYWDVYRRTLRGGAAGSVALIPSADADALLLLDAQLLLKALYEVRYELANRPRWVSWPLGAVAELLDDTASPP